MKKSASAEHNRGRQPGSIGDEKRASPTFATAKIAKPTAARKGEPFGLLEEHFPAAEFQIVRFEYFNPSAREVLVAGSFNDWQPRAMPMAHERDGRWSAEVMLKPGDYEYRLVVDGQWQHDPLAARFAANPFGSLNSVVQIQPSQG